MQIVLSNYANAYYLKSQQQNIDSGLDVGGFTKVFSYSPEDLSQFIQKNNSEILRCYRGNGYWLWKPYLICKSLKLLNEGDVLVYSDAGIIFLSSVHPLIELLLKSKQDLLVFDTKRLEAQMTKRDAFILMDCDESSFSSSKQRMGGFIVIRSSKFSKAFFKEFLQLAQDPRILTDIPNRCGEQNYEIFVDHRHDQSILSLLSKKYELESFRDPSQYGNSVKCEYGNSPYNQIIELTRKSSETRIERAMGKLWNRFCLFQIERRLNASEEVSIDL